MTRCWELKRPHRVSTGCGRSGQTGTSKRTRGQGGADGAEPTFGGEQPPPRLVGHWWLLSGIGAVGASFTTSRDLVPETLGSAVFASGAFAICVLASGALVPEVLAV